MINVEDENVPFFGDMIMFGCWDYIYHPVVLPIFFCLAGI